MEEIENNNFKKLIDMIVYKMKINLNTITLKIQLA